MADATGNAYNSMMGWRVGFSLRKWLAVGLVLMAWLSFPSAAYSQVENFPYNAQMPAGWAQATTTGNGFMMFVGPSVPLPAVTASWAVANDYSTQGTYSLKSALPFGVFDQQAAIEVTINVVTPGSVSFDYKVDSEANWDYIRFHVDGVEVFFNSGAATGTVTYPLSAGIHTLTWRYSKDSCCDSGSDTAWIDNVRLPGIPAVVGAYDHTLALKSNGTVAYWGSNSSGQTTLLETQTNVVKVAGSAQSHTVLLKSDGTVVAQGANGSGQITVPPGLSGAYDIAAGYDTSFALRSGDTLVAWGSDSNGQVSGVLGLPGAIDVTALHCEVVPPRPCAAARLSGMVAISANVWHGLILKSDGTVVAWGLNDAGQSTVPGGLSGVAQVAAGYQFSLALKSDGTVTAWGDNTEGQITGAAALSGVIAVSAGLRHGLALNPDGTVVAWGNNGNAQTTVPGGLSGVVGISAGWYSSHALKSDGTVVSWGGIGAGETTVPVGLNLDAAPPPAAPANFTATTPADPFGITQIDLSWDAALDNAYLVLGGISSGVTYYQVRREGVLIQTVNAPTVTYSDTGRNSSTTYNYTVTACDAANNCSTTAAAFSSTLAAAAPGTFTATTPAAPTGITQINLAWTASTGATFYEVRRGGSFLTSTASLSYNDTGLLASSTYNYTVAACGPNGCGSTVGTSGNTLAAEAPATFTATTPAAPTGRTQINLAWTASAGVTYYELTRNLSFLTTVNAATLAFNDTGLNASTTYNYTVRGCGPLGCGTTAGASANTLAAAAPGIFTASTPAAPTGITQINLSWTVSTGATFYEVRRGGVFVVTVPGLSYSDTGLNSSTTYNYTVAACGPNGCGATAASSANTLAAAAPGTFTATTPIAPAGVTQIDLAWTASTGATFYEVRRGGVFVVTVPGLSYNDTGLNSSTTYNYTVASCGPLGCGATAGATANTLAAAAPGTFTATTPAAPTGITQINLAWSASTGATYYELTRNGSFLTSTTGLSFNDTGLLASSTYNYTVAACGPLGCGTTAPASANTLAAAAPGTFTATTPAAPTGVTQINLAWTASTGATFYEVRRGGVFLTSTTSLAFNDTGLNSSTTYNYTVAGCGPLGCGATAGATADTLAAAAPGTFTATTPTAPTGVTQIDLAWTASTGATFYEVRRGGVFVVTVPGLSYNDTGLNSSTTYNYTVAACGPLGCGATAGASANTLTAATPGGFIATTPAAPTGITQINLAWSASTGAAFYELTRNGSFVATVPGLSYSDTGRNASTNYNYTIAACGPLGCSSTAAASANTLAAVAPGGFTATTPAAPTGITQIDLAWSASTGATSYELTRNGSFLTSTAGLSFNDTGLLASSTYNYTVAACGPLGCGTTAPASANTLAAAAPGTFTAITPAAPAGETQIDLAWSASTGATFYEVRRGGVFLTSTAGLSYNDTGLNSSTAYNYTVAACGPLGCGATAGASANTLTAATPGTFTAITPAAPTGITQIDLAWSASTGAAFYELTRNGSFLTSTAGLSFNDTGLLAASTYNYTVAACGPLGCSGTAVASANTLTAAAPGTFTATTPAAPTGITQINLAWTASAGATYYELTRNASFLTSTAGLSFNDTGLLASSTYNYTVVACGPLGCSSTAGASANTLAAAAPGTFTATTPAAPTGVTQIDLAWSASTGATFYELTRNGSFLTTVNAATLSFNDTGLNSSTTYNYTVAGCGPLGCGSTAAASANTLAAAAPATFTATTPAAPTGITQIDLAWSASAGATYYELTRNGSFLTSTASLSFNDTGLLASSTYNYTVVACGPLGCSSTAGASANTLAAAAPGTFTATTPAAPTGVTQIDLAWSASTGATFYELTRNGSFLTTVNAATLSFNDTGLNSSTTYNYTVAGCGPLGCGSTAAASANTLAAAAPATFTATTPAAPTGITQIDLAWSASAGATYYELTRNGSFLTSTASLSFNDTGLLASSTYNYTVAACGPLSCGATAGASANTLTATGPGTFTATTPAAPTGITQIDLAWSASAGATYYELTRNGSFLTSTAGLSFNDTGLLASSTYNYTVAACGPLGCSSTAGASANTLAAAAPGTFTATTPAAPTGVTQIDLAWTASTGATYYGLTRNGSFLTTVNAATLAFSDTGLNASTAYNYLVAACGPLGCGSTAAASANTLAAAAPATFTATTPAAPTGETQIDLAWSASTGATYYELNRNGSFLTSTAGLSFNDTGLTAGTTYNYTVAGCGPLGCGTTAATSGTTLPPATPATFTAITPAAPAGVTQIDLAWSASAGASFYEVRRGGVFLTSTAGLSFNDTGLLASSTYNYTVAACGPASCSATIGASANTLATVAPGGFTATAVSATQIDLAWSTTAGAAFYEVRRAGSFVATVPGLAYSDTGLLASTAYSYTVAACGPLGCSATAAASANTLAAAAPATFTATASPTNATVIDLAWAASAGASSYRIDRDGVFLATVNTPTLAFGSTGLTATTTYNYTVAACGPLGCGGTIAASATTIAPAAPVTFNATPAGATQIDLDWSGSAGATYYLVKRGGTAIATVNAPTVVVSDTGLLAATTYNYTVEACGPAACSLTATAVSGSTALAATPTGFTATPVSGTEINLSWSASTGATYYRLTRNAAFLANVNAPAAAYPDTGLTASTTYNYTVEACGPNGCSATASTSGSTFFIYTPVISIVGFNQLGNSLNTTINVVATFGAANPASPVESVWTWNSTTDNWKFYSPLLDAAQNASYAATNGFEVLTTINAGEGYWVNATVPVVLPAQVGALFSYNSTNFAVQVPPAGSSNTGWYLISTSDTLTPSQFNAVITPQDYYSLWMWNVATSEWFFYSPVLETQGGLPLVKSTANANGWLHFQDFGKTLGLGAGFWVNRP